MDIHRISPSSSRMTSCLVRGPLVPGLSGLRALPRIFLVLAILGLLVVPNGNVSAMLGRASDFAAIESAETRGVATLSDSAVTGPVTQGPAAQPAFIGAQTQGDFLPDAGGLTASGFMTWTVRSSMPTARHGVGLAASGGKVYAVGGYGGATLATVEEYDPATDTWRSRASLPAPRYEFGLVTAPNGRIYAIGGCNGYSCNENSVFEYDPPTDTWATRASMPTARGTFGIAVGQNGKIYAMGGMQGNSGALTVVEEYDPVADHWTTKASMPSPRRYFSAATASNGKIYAIAGQGVTDAIAVGTVSEYDPTSDVWAARSDTPVPHYWSGVVADQGGKIYSIAGDTENNEAGITSTLRIYDAASDTWSVGASLNTPRYSPGAAILSGTIYVAGGTTYGAANLSTLETLTLQGALPEPTATRTATPSPTATSTPAPTPCSIPSLSWSATSPMLARRAGHRTAEISGTLYVAGGMASLNILATGMLSFDLATQSWSNRPGPLTPRGYAGAAAVDGQLYLLGGMTTSPMYYSLDMIERYNPASNSWTTLAPMPFKRHNFSTVVGPNGHIYLFGGEAYGAVRSWSLDTADEYNPSTGAWTSLAPMPAKRQLASAVLGSDGAIYVIGGFDWQPSGDTRLSAVHRYDILANSWTTVTALPASRIWGAAVGLDGGLVQMGGQDFSGNNVSTLYTYEFGASSWQTGTAIPVALTDFTADRASDGNIYVIGGGQWGASTYELGVYRAPVAPCGSASTSTPTPTPTPTSTATPTVSPNTSTATATHTQSSTPIAIATSTNTPTPSAPEGGFSPGNVVVCRVGSGVGYLSNTGNPVFLDEYTPGGVLVASYPLPTAPSGGNYSLIAAGTSTSECLLTRSTDSQFLVVTGYSSTVPATASLTALTALAVNRTIGLVGASGLANTSTALRDFASSSSPRSAASDNGTNLWVAGGAGGVRYTTLGAITSTQITGREYVDH